MVKHLFHYFLPLAVCITLLCGLLYISVQQVLRQDANDPQIQIASDASQKLSQGTESQQFIMRYPVVDISKSLSPFLIIYNSQGHEVASSGKINMIVPEVPQGVLLYAKNHRYDRFTWETKESIRIAAVVVPFSGQQSGYVLAGRSLWEVETRESNLLFLVGIGWIVTLFISFISIVFTKVLYNK